VSLFEVAGQLRSMTTVLAALIIVVYEVQIPTTLLSADEVLALIYRSAFRSAISDACAARAAQQLDVTRDE
jgi:hypothetical protein